jgi:hypothetical protein
MFATPDGQELTTKFHPAFSVVSTLPKTSQRKSGSRSVGFGIGVLIYQSVKKYGLNMLGLSLPLLRVPTISYRIPLA